MHRPMGQEGDPGVHTGATGVGRGNGGGHGTGAESVGLGGRCEREFGGVIHRTRGWLDVVIRESVELPSSPSPRAPQPRPLPMQGE